MVWNRFLYERRLWRNENVCGCSSSYTGGSVWHDVSSYAIQSVSLLIKEAIKAVIGVGKKGKQLEITPTRVLLFAFLVASIFLGTVTILLIIASLIT